MLYRSAQNDRTGCSVHIRAQLVLYSDLTPQQEVTIIANLANNITVHFEDQMNDLILILARCICEIVIESEFWEAARGQTV